MLYRLFSIAIVVAVLFLEGVVAEDGGARPSLPTSEAIALLPEDGGEAFNRLIFEKSPYLLQHARNPVDWYPWGDGAFERAQAEGKLVFLSVGYSTCHWCHVMERESFEDPEVAALLKAGYVAVKVDREERPDIDEIYMAVTQAMTGSGGWPMTVILTPDRKPVFAGTYFPKEGRGERIGLMELLPRITEAYQQSPEKFADSASRITEFLRAQGVVEAGEVEPAAVLRKAFGEHADTFDGERGGFGPAPKFPTPHRLMYLLRYWKRSGDGHALAMVEKTLTAMRLGGMYDHVGHGFHRYSVDPEWRVPHFEKMLYDQALHVLAYTEAWQATGDDFFGDVARDIASYVLRELAAPEGGFYSAEDADSAGEEGKFYVWTLAEIQAVLGEVDGALYGEVYHLAAGGNWTEGREAGTNIPYRDRRWGETAEAFQLTEAELKARMEACRRKLFAAREDRVHPFKDDKILTDWNGLMIAALAKAGRTLGEERFTDHARKAADFILAEMRTEEGRLHHRYRQGEAGLPAHLEDYAFLVWGLLELYESTFEANYLEAAVALNGTLKGLFWDASGGGYYMTASDGEPLLVRPKTLYDGAIPSGNSVAAYNLVRLSRLTGDTALESMARGTAQAFGTEIDRSPSNYAMMLLALDYLAGPSLEIVISGARNSADTAAMIDAVRKPFLPNKVVLFRPDGADAGAITRIAPYTEGQVSMDGAATAYVCENFVCSFPTTSVSEMVGLLRRENSNDE